MGTILPAKPVAVVVRVAVVVTRVVRFHTVTSVPLNVAHACITLIGAGGADR
jgi:hypothetical protein